ncbi:MAG: OB-fold nucleic acid binding domain-containing protein [Bryobacterales bacterium]|nr:OB-fold nucleic acid binding domain-containing protein [Bryobacterales bacterium]
MSKEHYIRDLRVLGPDERFRSVFLVQAKDLRQNKKTGDPFLSMQLADCTGTLDARMWDVREGLADQFQVNDFIDVHGRIQVYRERPQIIVHKLSAVPDDQVTLSDFMPHTKHDVEAMYAKVLSLIDSFQDRDLKRLLKSIFENPDIAKAYKRAPAAKSMHHARLGGLLEHVSSVLNLAVAVSANYEDVDRDLLISGVLLHDLGKVYELKSDRSFEYSDAGLLLGHIPIGSAWLGRCCDEIKGFPPRLKMLLVHMVLSHHGKREFGSPQLPAFPEALALHFIDDLDSKLEMMRTATADLMDGEVWSRYPKGLDGPVLDKAAYLRETSTRSAPDTPAVKSPPGDPLPSSLHLSPAPDLPAATPVEPSASPLEDPSNAGEAEFQLSRPESPPKVDSEAGSQSEGVSVARGEPVEPESPAPTDLVPASEYEDTAAEGSRSPEAIAAPSRPSSADPERNEASDVGSQHVPANLPSPQPTIQPAPELPFELAAGSEASQSIAKAPETEPSDSSSDTGPAQRPEAAPGSTEASSPQQAAATPDAPTLPEMSPEAPAIGAAAATDGHGGAQVVDKAKLPQPLELDADAQHDPAVMTALEPEAPTADSERTSSIESGPPEPPPALPPLESVAQAVPEPALEGSAQSDQSESEQPSEERVNKAPTIESTKESKPALRPEPVNRPTIVSSPSRVATTPAAPPLPNPPPDSPTTDENEGSLQGALFELEEPSAEYPG